MGDYDVTAGGSGKVVYGPPPPPPPTDDEKKKVGTDPNSAGAAPPPNGDALKKITTEVKSLGVKIPKDYLDEKGNIRQDKIADAKKLIVDEAAKRKAKDVGAAARLLQKAVSLDPQDKALRLETAKTFKAWADTQTKPDVKLTTLKAALDTLKPVGDKDQSDLFIDYSKEYAGLCLKAKKGPEGRQQLAKAALVADEKGLDGLHEFLSKPENAGLLNENEHPWMFLGDVLSSVKKFDEACFAYNRGVNAAHKDKNIPLRDEFNQRWKLAHEGKYPPQLDFVDPISGEVANPVAAGLYKALKAQGIAGGDMDKGVDGKEPDNKISATEVFNYISNNLDDPKVQEVLNQAQIHIPEEEKKTAKTLGLGLYLADKYTHEAERLKKEDPKNSVDTVAKLLTFATNLDPDNPKRSEALGDFFAEQKAYPLAMQAYAESLNAAKAMPKPDKNPRAMEGHGQWLQDTEKRLKGKIEENFDKGIKVAQDSAREIKNTANKEGVTPQLAMGQLQVLQGAQGMYDLYAQLFPDEMKTPKRLSEQGALYDVIGQALQAAGKKGEAKAFYAKAIEQYQAGINANKNDAGYCIGAYDRMGAAHDALGNYKEALIAYSKASMCEKLRINYNPKLGGQVPSLNDVKHDRGPNMPYGAWDNKLGNYIHSDVHDINRVDKLDTLPEWASGPRDNYISKLKARIDGGADYRAELRGKTPPDQAAIFESMNEEAKLLTFFGRDDEATKIGAEAAELKAKVDNEKLGKEVEVHAQAGLIDQKGLEAVSAKENKDQANPLKFGDYVKFEKGSDGKTKVSFTPAYESLDTPTKNRVMSALVSAAQRTQISQNIDKAKGPAKLFYEGQLAIFDDNRELAKTKLEEFSKEAKGSKDPQLTVMLRQADGALHILSQDGKQKPEDVLRDLRTMLVPLAMTLKPGQDGGIDLSAISKSEVKTFDDFKKYLADQVSVDGVSFNAVLFASYEKVMTNPKHEALLKQLYKQFNSSADAPEMSVADMQSALRAFQKDIIDVSAGRFVGSHLNNAKGRDQLRTLLEDPTLDKGIKAKLCEEIVEMGEGQGYTPPHISALFQSKVNGHGFYFQDDKLALGVSYAMRVLNMGDQKDVAHSKQIEKYSLYPHEIQRLNANELDHTVTPQLIKETAQLVKDLQGRSDGISMMRAKLATMYLTVVDNDQWSVDKTTNRFKDRVTDQQRAELANALKHLLSEADGVKTNADFAVWNGRVRRLLRGQGGGKDSDVAGVAKEYLGNYVGDMTADAAEKLTWVVSKTPEDAFDGMAPTTSGSYKDLLRFVDEVHVSELNGVPVEVLPPNIACTDPARREKTQDLIQGLRGVQRGFWYNYQQRNMLSRKLSESASLAGMGDIASIDNANKEINGIIADLEKATTQEDFEKAKARITRATKSGGAIHEGFSESEMDGTEQMINLVQTIAEIVVITYVTQGLGTEAALGRATVTLGQTAARTRNLRMAYQAFQEVRTVSNAARAAELMEAASIARYGSLAGELRTVTAGAAEVAEAQKMFSGSARLAQALSGEAGFATKAASGFKLGAQISITENVIGSLSGQLRTEPQTLLDWMKDATATGFSMVVSAGLNPSFGKAMEEGVVKGLFQRYVAGGAKGALHFLGDTGLEIVEEVVDNYVRKKLDGDYSKLSWDELRDITMVCFAGGVKQGMTSHFVNFTKGRIVDAQVKRYNEGFEARGERVVSDPKLGYVLVDSEGGFIRKTDKLGLQSFMAFEADTQGPGAKGIEIVSFDSTEKGAKGSIHVSDLELFPVVEGDKVKTDVEIKVKTEKAAAESKAKVEQKVKDDKARKLFGDFLSRGQYVEEVKRKDGVVVGLALYDAKGVKLRDATKDEMEVFQDFNRLTMGFALRGEKVVGSAGKGYQLVDKQGQTIRQATAAELTLYINHKRKTQVETQSPNADPQAKVYHDQAVAHLIAEMKTDLEKGAEVRHKTQPADKIVLSDANDPAAKAKETDGKVQYFVKVKPDGSKVTPTDVDISKFQAGKVDGPIILGIEMVDKDGKVIREDLTTNHLEAFEAWKKQEKQAPIDAALKEAGIKATDEAGKKLQGDLLKLSEEGKISKQDLKTASGEGMSKSKIAELESQLGMSRSQWLAELAKDPVAFKARLHTIEVTRAKAEDVVSKITSGANRAEVKTQILADLKKAGVEISTNTEKAVDSMIDLTLTAQKNGIVGMDKGQLTPGQLAGLMTTLYLNQSPSVRIGGAELTHVPMVVEGTLSFLLTDNPKATASDKRVAFVTALFHDAGKWDPNMRTESGFTVKQHPFFNPTGMDLEIKPGETLDEGLSRLVKEGKLSEENKAKVKIPGYLISVIAHHDSKSVHDAMSNLEAQGVLKKGEGEKVWQAIERHGLISSWILDNSFGGIGVLSHVFNKPEFARYVELYQSINGRLAKGEQINLGVLSTDKELVELRQIFATKFSPLERAMLLGDHQGQIDVAKYLDILSTVYQNPVTDPAVAGGKGEVIVTPQDAKVSDVFFARDPRIQQTHGVLGVIQKHALEQSMVDSTQGIFAAGPSERAQGWVTGEGLVQAINPKETRDKATGVQKEFRDWAAKNGKNEDSPAAMKEWLGTVPLFKQTLGPDNKPVLEKNQQGKPIPDPRFTEIRNKVETAFYQWYALSDAKPLEIHQAHDGAKAEAKPDPKAEAATAEKSKQVTEWRGAFALGVTIEAKDRKGTPMGFEVKGVTEETARFFYKDQDGKYFATKDQFAAFQQYDKEMKAKESAKAKVIEIGAKIDAKKPTDENGNPDIRMAARAAAVDVLFDPNVNMSPEKLSKDVETIVSVVQALDPVFKALAPTEKAKFQEQIVRQIQDGTLDVATAKKMAEQVANGENPRDVLLGKAPKSVSAISLIEDIRGDKTPVESIPPPPPTKGEKLKPKDLLSFTTDGNVTDKTKEAISNWIDNDPKAPKTQAEIEALLVDLKKGAELKADGKILVIADGHVFVETITQVKERMGYALKTFEKMKAEGKVLADFEKRALLERVIRQPGKSEANIEADVRYALENADKFAGEVKDLPAPLAKNLTERYLRGDISLYSARQSSKEYRGASERAKALGVLDFDQRLQARIEAWYPEAQTDPSLAMEKTLATFESVISVLEPVMNGMDPAARKTMAENVMAGKMTVDQAHDYVVEATLGHALDAMPPKEAEAVVRQFLKTTLGKRYTAATEATYNNYFKAHGARKVMADALSAMAFDYHISTLDFIKLGQNLEGLDSKAQIALLGNLMAQAKLIGGVSTTEMDPKAVSLARMAVGAMVLDTIQLAKQMHDLDAGGQAKLIKELGEGKYSLQGAMLQADRIATDARLGVKSSDPDQTHPSGSKLGPKPAFDADGDVSVAASPLAKKKAAQNAAPAPDGDATNPGVPAAKLKAKQGQGTADEEVTKPGVPIPKQALAVDPNVEAAGKIGDPGTSGVHKTLEAAGQDKAKIAAVLEPYEAVAKAIEPGSKELAESLRKDLEILKTGDANSPEYKEALRRTQALQTILRSEGNANLDADHLANAVKQSRQPPATNVHEDTTVVSLPAGGATALGLLTGAVALFSPEMAHAAEGAARDLSSRGGVGPAEAAVIVGIGLLIAGPAIVKKYLKKGPPPPPAVTKGNPIKLQSDTKQGLLYPFSKSDWKNAEVNWPGKLNLDDSMVIGDRVYLALDTAMPGEKSSQSVLPMSIEDAKRLGVEFDAHGNIKKVPGGEFVYYEGTTKKSDNDISMAATSMDFPIAKTDTPVALKDADGNVSQLRPLSVTDAGKGEGTTVSYGKAVSVDIGKGENDPVKVKVEVFDPADPEADPKVLSFGLGKPKVLEARTFEMSRAEAIQLGILKVEKHGSPPVLAENAVLALNDEAAGLHRNNRVYVPTSNEGGLTFYPSKAMGKKERVLGDIVKIDTEKTTRQGDTVYVWMRTPDPSAKDGTKLHSAEPVPMSLADARKLGIYVSHDGSLKIVSNEFIMTPVTKTGDQVLVGGKPFTGETDEGVSVMFRLGKDGKIELNTVEKPQAPKAELLPPQPKADLSGKKIPEALKVLGPLGVGLYAMAPGTAEAATQISDTAATGGWMAAAGLGLTMLLGMAWWSGGGNKGPEGPNHPPMVPADGVTRFEFRVGVDGKPTIVTGIHQQTAMTFQRGPGGQWYAHEGDPPSETAQGVQANWKPIKDGDLVKVFNPNTGEAYIIPFQAPKDAWIPGYAPSVMTDGPAQPAASGSLPVGKLTAINPYVDDRPFTIGRNAGDLKYGDLGVSDPHVIIQRNLATGKYVLVNGKTGDAKVNEVLIGGVKMGKWAELKDGDVFAVRGANGQLAYFQFTEPKTPAGRVSPGGFVVIQGQSYSVKKYKQEVMYGVGALYGSVTFCSPIPGDPAGSITLAVFAGPNFDPKSGKHGTIAITVSAKQAKELGIVIGKDGRPVQPVEIKLTPGIEQQQMDQAAVANAATPLDVPAPPPPPAPKLKVVPSPNFVEAKFGNESFRIEPHPKSQAMAPFGQYGQFTRVTPHAMPGVYVAEITYGPPGDSSKKMVINLTPAEMKSLGVKFNDQGQPIGSEFFLKILPTQVQPAPVDLSKVQMLLDDHVPGKPRSGEVGVAPTVDYGTASGQTHVGIGSKKLGPDPVNEDALIQGKDYAVVLDGMGGQGHGDKASSIPGEAIARYLEEHKNDPDQAKVMADAFQYGYQVLWNSPLYDQIRADAKAKHTPDDEIKWPGTVGVAHKVVPDGKGGFNAIIVHVGDAGGVVVDKNGKVKYRTQDQGFAQMLVGKEAKDQGKDPTAPDVEKKKRFHPHGNIVTGGIGGASAPKPVVEVVHLEPGDRIIMFSDGVGDNMSTTDIVNKALGAKNAKEAKSAIMQSTLQKLEDLEDAIYELKPGKRLPITQEDGTTVYIAKGGAIYPTLTGGEQIDYYKPDNVTVHVYEHNPATNKPSTPPPPSGPRLVPNPPPVAKPKSGAPVQAAVHPGTKVTADELASLAKLPMRDVPKNLLTHPHFKPTSKVEIDGQSFYLSGPILSRSSSGKDRLYVLALVPMEEKGTTVLKRRFFYKSESDGGWRACPFKLGSGWLSKGEGIHYTQETQPVEGLNQAFMAMEENPKAFGAVRTSSKELNPFISLDSDMVDNAAAMTMVGGFGYEIEAANVVGMTNVGAIQAGKLGNKKDMFGKVENSMTGPEILSRMESFTYPPGFIPDFNAGPTKSWSEDHTHLGKVKMSQYEGSYLIEKGTGKKRPVVWTMAEDSQGRVWIESIRLADAKVNSYGVYEEVINSGALTSKPLEYHDQMAKIAIPGFTTPFNADYSDITPALSLLKPIREYRKAQGLQDPGLKAPTPGPVEISANDVKEYVPPPNPLKIVPSTPQIRIASNTEGVFRVDSEWQVDILKNGSYPFTYQIGRPTFNDGLDATGVSLHHVQIYRRIPNGPIWIQDLGSKNGTVVIRNGQSVYPEKTPGRPGATIVLHPGDEIHVGTKKIKVV